MESPLSSGGEGAGLPQVWEYFSFPWRGEGSPFCVPSLWGSSNPKLEEAEPGFEGRCRVKERRIPRGLVGDLYCVIPRRHGRLRIFTVGMSGSPALFSSTLGAAGSLCSLVRAAFIP